RMLIMLLEGAQLLDPLAVVIVHAVAEVEAEHVGAGLEQGAQALGAGGCWPQGGDDLGKTLATHRSSLFLGRPPLKAARLLVDFYDGRVIQPAPAGAGRREEELMRGSRHRQ